MPVTGEMFVQTELGNKLPRNNYRRHHHPVLDFAMAAAAAACAVLLSNPMEVVKTRMQLQGELGLRLPLPQAGQAASMLYRNSAHAFFRICKDEGLRGIQAGLLPGVLLQITMNGTRLSLFGPIQKFLRADGEKNGRTGSYFLRNLAAGAACGACGAVVGSPIFMIKARLQSQSAGNLRRRSMTQAIREVVRTDGWRGMTRGMGALMVRTAVGSGTQLASYSSCKAAVLSTGLFEDNVYAYLASSMVAGLVVTTAMQPFDMVSTRLFTQGGRADGVERYSGMLDCAAKTVKAEGYRGLFKGWTPHYFREGPHTILTFLFWEEIKNLVDRWQA